MYKYGLAVPGCTLFLRVWFDIMIMVNRNAGSCRLVEKIFRYCRCDDPIYDLLLGAVSKSFIQKFDISTFGKFKG